MRILITGSTGLLGQALCERLAPPFRAGLASAHDIWGLSRHAASEPRHIICDLTDRAQVIAQTAAIRPDLIIHAAAQSDVDRSEWEPQAALAGNMTATQHMVEASQAGGARLVYISTDYVFDGLKGVPYTETDLPHPVSYYGQTKLDAERAVQQSGLSWCIVRTSALFGPGRSTFVDTVIRQAEAGQPIRAFVDQTISPSYTVDVADGVARLVAAAAEGLVHVVNAGAATRAALARAVLDVWGLRQATIQPVRLSEAGLPARRPLNSSLSIARLRHLTSWSPPGWHEALQRYLAWKRRSQPCKTAL